MPEESSHDNVDAVYAGDESDDEEDAPPPPPQDGDEENPPAAPDSDDSDDDGGEEDAPAKESNVSLAQPDVSLFDGDDDQSAADVSSGISSLSLTESSPVESLASIPAQEDHSSHSHAHAQELESSGAAAAVTNRGGRRKSITTEDGLDTADVPECELGRTHAAARVAKERADRLKILNYWGISDTKKSWKDRERQAIESGAKTAPVVKPLK